MPIKITYDLNNEQECKLIDDYYFFKSYYNDLIFGWEKFYFSKDYDPLIIKAHLNKTEFNRFIELYEMILDYFYGSEILMKYLYNFDIFIDVFNREKKELFKIYKSYIIYKLQKNYKPYWILKKINL